MRKRALLAFFMAAVLLMTTGCSLIVKDPEVDRSTVIVEVGNETITKAQVQQATQTVLDNREYEASYYSYYYGMNMGFDRNDAATVASAQEEAVDLLISSSAQAQKSKELGLDVFSEADEAQAQADAEADWQTYYDYVRNVNFADTELTGEELDAAVLALTEQMVGLGKEDALFQIKQEKLAKLETERLREETVKDVAVSDEEVAQQYAADQQAAKDSFAADPNAYSRALMNGSYIYAVPAGYRYIKHILVQFSDEDKQAISDAQTAVNTKQSELSAAEADVTALQGGTLTAAEGEALPTQEELDAKVTALTAEKAELEAKLAAAKEAAYAALQPTIDEIVEKIAAGEDFDALIEQYGQDSGMKNSPTKETGYAVCADGTSYVAEFQEAAMALAAVGDVSEPVKSDADQGIHILKYIGESVESDVEADEEKLAEIKNSLLTAKQDEYYDAAVAQWIEALKPVTHLDRMN